MATPSISPVLDDQDQNQTSQASSTIPSETQTLSQSEEVCTSYIQCAFLLGLLSCTLFTNIL